MAVRYHPPIDDRDDGEDDSEDTPKALLLRHGVRELVVGLLEGLQSGGLGFVLPRDVPSDRVVPGERPRAEGTVHPDALMTLPYVGAQIRLIAVESLAVRALQFVTCE